MSDKSEKSKINRFAISPLNRPKVILNTILASALAFIAIPYLCLFQDCEGLLPRAVATSLIFVIRTAAPILYLISLAVILGYFLRKIFKSAKRPNALLCTVCATYLVIALPLSQMSHLMRVKAYTEATTRLKPLAEAIEKYQRDTKELPESLAALTPSYIQRVPHTGMAAYPKVDYRMRRQRRRHWSLTVSVETDLPYQAIHWNRGAFKGTIVTRDRW